MKNIFRKNKLFATLLNLLGMSLAITAFIAILIQVRFDFGYDTQYPDSKNIYRFEFSFEDGTGTYMTTICRPFIESLKTGIPGVESIGTYRYIYSSKDAFTLDGKPDQVFSLPVAEADRGMMDVLGIELLEGRMEDFDDEDDSKILISKSTAQMLFGDESAVGKPLIGNSGQWHFTIAGVYPDPPANSSIPNGVIYQLGTSALYTWSEWSFDCYLRISPGASLEDILNIIDEQGDDQDALDRERCRLTNIHDAYFLRDLAEDSLAKGNLATTRTLLAVSLLLLVIAFINFVNFTTAAVPFDIKSINTRRVLGSTRASLILHSLADGVTIALLAFVISILLLQALSGSFLAGYISDSIQPADNISTLVLGLVATLLCSILAGLYPAFYATSFQPALVLKGSFSLSVQGRALRNVLVAVQYVASFVLASFALYIFVQTRFMKEHDMGFNSDQVLAVYISRPIARNPDGFEQKLLQNPDILDVTYTGTNLVSNSKMGWGRYVDGQRVQLDVITCTVDYLDFFGMSVIEGRPFMESDNYNVNGTFILNETAMQTYPFLRVGTKMAGHKGDDQPAEIVGVVKDFNFKPMQYPVSPLALYVFGPEPWWPLSLCYVRVSPERIASSIDYIKDALKEFDPGISDDYLDIDFLDEINGNFYKREEKLNTLITFASGLSFLIAIIGILGLVYFETQFKRKETAVRKVFGAEISDIILSINLKYLWLALGSFAVSVPLTLYILKSWVRSFSYQSPVPVWIFLASLAAGLLVTVVTVTLRSLSAASSNPVESLKNE